MREQEVQSVGLAFAPSRLRRASWGAIFAGVFVTIILQIILTVLGVAIGVATLHGPQQQQELRTLTTTSGIWLLVTGLIATWVGSCVAGRLSGGPLRTDGMVHGIVTWSVATFTAFYLLASAVSAALGAVGSALGGAITQFAHEEGAQSAAGSLQASSPSPTGRTEGESTPGKLTELAAQDHQLAGALARLEKNGGASKDPKDRDEVINLLKTKHDQSQQDAANLVSQWDQQVQQKGAQAVQTGERDVAQGAWWAFVALVLGLIFAAWGGWVGAASLPVLGATTTQTTGTAPA